MYSGISGPYSQSSYISLFMNKSYMNIRVTIPKMKIRYTHIPSSNRTYCADNNTPSLPKIAFMEPKLRRHGDNLY